MQLSDIQIGTRFKGNINGAIIQIVDIENGYVIWKDCKSGCKGTTDIKTFSHLQMERSNNSPKTPCKRFSGKDMKLYCQALKTLTRANMAK